MLAISAQGFLFNLGTIFFGINPIGVWIGSVLLSLWGFIQPIGIYMLLFGENLVYMAKYFLKNSLFFRRSRLMTFGFFNNYSKYQSHFSNTRDCSDLFLEKDDYIKWQENLIKRSASKKKKRSTHNSSPIHLKRI